MAKLAIEYRNESDKLQYVLVEERLSEKHEVSHSKLTSLKLEPSAAGPGASASIGAIEQQKKQEATGSTEKPSGQSASSDVRGKHVLPMESVRYQVDDWQVRVLVRYETGETFGPYYRQHPLLVFGLRQDTYPVLKMFGKEVRCGNRVRLFSYKYGDALRMVHSKKTDAMAHVELGSEQDEGVQCLISSDLATDKYDGNPLALTDAGDHLEDVKIVFGGKFLLFGTDPKKILRGKRVYVGQASESGWMLVKAGPSESRVPPPDFKVYQYADPRDLREGDIIKVTHVNSGKCLSTSPSGRLVVSEYDFMDVSQYFYFMLEK